MLVELFFHSAATLVVACFLIFQVEDVHSVGFGSLEPNFDVPIVNVTVVAGQNIVLHCSIDRLGKYKVIWLDPNSFPLTFEEKRVIDDPRFSVIRSQAKEWNLYIRNVRRKDDGTYRCTVNTSPVRSKMVVLHVKVSPQILSEFSSGDMVVNEGDTVLLRCNVTGVPLPEVTWYRRPAKVKSWSHAPEKLGSTGEVLVIQNVSRYCGDIYECVANNGVPPRVSRQIRVTVQFAPEIRLHNRRIGQKKGRDAVLECFITSLPLPSYRWERGSERIFSDDRRAIDAYEDLPNTITLRLTIEGVRQQDFGEYICRAENQLGKEHESITIYEFLEAADFQQSRHQRIQHPLNTVSMVIPSHAENRDHGDDDVTEPPPSIVPATRRPRPVMMTEIKQTARSEKMPRKTPASSDGRRNAHSTSGLLLLLRTLISLLLATVVTSYAADVISS